MACPWEEMHKKAYSLGVGSNYADHPISKWYAINSQFWEIFASGKVVVGPPFTLTILIRGIRYLTDQNSLINPEPQMHLNMFYSNSFWKNCKVLASETIIVHEMKWPSVTGAEVNDTYYVNQIFLVEFSLKIIDKFQRRRLLDLRNWNFLNLFKLFPRI